MKWIVALVLGLMMFGSVQAGRVPTPKSAISFAFGDDPRGWNPQFKHGNEEGVVMEFVPKGHKIDAWKEKFANQVIFTPVTAGQFAEGWKQQIKRSDPKAEVKVETIQGGLMIKYTSLVENECGIMGIFQGEDGLYMLNYYVRPKEKNAAIYKKWTTIIQKAHLVDNPV